MQSRESLRETLITRGQATVLFTVLLVLGLVAAPLVWNWAKRRGMAPLPTVLLWCGGPVAVGILWPIYNTITDRMGLDSIANLLVNFALFVVLGIVGGVVWTRLTPKGEE